MAGAMGIQRSKLQSCRTKSRSQPRLHYENMPIQIYRKFYHQNMKIFR